MNESSFSKFAGPGLWYCLLLGTDLGNQQSTSCRSLARCFEWCVGQVPVGWLCTCSVDENEERESELRNTSHLASKPPSQASRQPAGQPAGRRAGGFTWAPSVMFLSESRGGNREREGGREKCPSPGTWAMNGKHVDRMKKICRRQATSRQATSRRAGKQIQRQDQDGKPRGSHAAAADDDSEDDEEDEERQCTVIKCILAIVD